jgi:hypothetical protein
MAIGAGGASMASSGQIAGGPMLPLGMKPGEKVKKRKRGSVISASPAIHNKDALALQEKELLEDLFEYSLDKSDRGMKNLWSGLSDVSGEDEPVKTDSENLYGLKVRKD